MLNLKEVLFEGDKDLSLDILKPAIQTAYHKVYDCPFILEIHPVTLQRLLVEGETSGVLHSNPIKAHPPLLSGAVLPMVNPPQNSATRYLDAQCSEQALDAVVAQLPVEVSQETDARIAKEFAELGMDSDSKPDSKPWLSRRRELLRQMLSLGHCNFPLK